MLTIDLENFSFELKDGAVKHVGASNVSGEAKLYDVEAVDVREYGGERVKVTFESEDDNTVEIALFPEEAQALAAGLSAVDVALD